MLKLLLMKELFKIQEKEGKQAVSARELHNFLGSRKQFSDWIKDRIKKYGLVENQDFVIFSLNSEKGRPTIEYALTLDCAKELSMVEGNSKGRKARQYFIECEKQIKSSQKPLSQIDIIIQSAQLIKEQDKRLSSVESKVKEIEAKTTTRPDYFTIVGFGTLRGLKINLQQACRLGQRASKLCRDRGYETDTIPDPRFGQVKMYPSEVLEELFMQPIS